MHLVTLGEALDDAEGAEKVPEDAVAKVKGLPKNDASAYSRITAKFQQR